MATDASDAGAGFGTVSRLRGAAFRVIAFAASVVGILALGVLLVYVAVDAFDLADASPAWLFTYLGTVVAPYLAFCLYAAGDRVLVRRTVGVLAGGLLAIPTVFLVVESLLAPVPGLTWPVAYLFAVVAPASAYATYAAARERVGAVGLGVTVRLLGGAGLGLAIVVLLVVVDDRLLFLAHTLGVVPAALLYGYARYRDRRLTPAVLPVGLVGLVAAAATRAVLNVYPASSIIYLWIVTVPVAVAAGGLLLDRSRRLAVTAAAIPLGAGVASVGAVVAGLAPEATPLVTSLVAAPTGVYAIRTIARREGAGGLLLPVLLVGGAVLGWLVVRALGLSGPDPWLDVGFVTGAPSSTATEAGLYPAIVGSIVVIALVAVLSFALGVGTALFLEEYTAGSGLVGALTRLIQVNIANLAAVPSVVYGLLGLGLFANLLGFGYGTAVTASLTLSLLILPITVISAQEAIRSVPSDRRQASYGMGATRWQTVKRVVLPEALPGIFTGTILALGRAIGETAPLIMIGAATSVFSPPSSVWSKVSAMPMQIYAWSAYPQPAFRYGVVAAGVVTLLVVLLGMNATAIVLRNRAERGP